MVPLRLILGPPTRARSSFCSTATSPRSSGEPVLVVPNAGGRRPRRARLLARAPARSSAARSARSTTSSRDRAGGADARRSRPTSQRGLLVRRVVAARPSTARRLGPLRRLRRVARCRRSPSSRRASSSRSELDGELARLHAAYRAELDRLRLVDREPRAARAAERLAADLAAWDGEPVFAYGFEDLTGAEWALLEALAGAHRGHRVASVRAGPRRASRRCGARPTTSPASPAGAIEELPPRDDEYAHAGARPLERALFADAPRIRRRSTARSASSRAPAGRATLELVGEELLVLLRSGTPPERIAVVCPTLDAVRAPLETASGRSASRTRSKAGSGSRRRRSARRSLALLRFAWLGGDRRDLFAFLRSPFSGLQRARARLRRGRLRGREIDSPSGSRRRRCSCAARRSPGSRSCARRRPARGGARARARMLRDATVSRAARGRGGRLDLRAYETRRAARRGARGLAGARRRAGTRGSLAALERATVRSLPGRAGPDRCPRPAPRAHEAIRRRLPPRARGRQPVEARPLSLFLDDEDASLDGWRRWSGPTRSIATVTSLHGVHPPQRTAELVREAAGDEGIPREPSPFWDEGAGVFDRRCPRWTRRRPLSSLTWSLDAHRPRESVCGLFPGESDCP